MSYTSGVRGGPEAPVRVATVVAMTGEQVSEPIAASGRTRRPRRTWPQRILLLLGIILAIAFFGAARFFWEARTVLADLPRISVGPDVLAQEGSPGEPINVLLLGVDSSEGLDPDDPVRQGRDVEDEARGIVRPDAILILRLDPATGRAAVLSLPRDLIVEAPGGSVTRINATQAVGGVESLITTIDNNFAIPINNFVVADFAGFAELVELVGGVPINFPFPTRDLGSGLAVDAGCFALNGAESLAYVRARSIEEFIDGEWTPLAATAPDLARIERQQEFLVLALEEVFSVGRADISRLRGFVDAGSQAVQLDEQLTPGDMLELASAFADYDTDALRVTTIPVRASFSEEGIYLGEQFQAEQAGELLAVFQGTADGVRPSQVELAVGSNDDRHAEQLGERGFVTQQNEQTRDGPTQVVFDPADREQAELVARYLEAVPAFAVEPGQPLRLDVGPDFSGIRQFPRPQRDVAIALDAALSSTLGASEAPPGTAPSQASQTATTAPETATATQSGDESSVTSFATATTSSLPSNSVAELTDEPNGSTTTQVLAPTINVRGRPAVGATCNQTGG